MTQIKKVLKSHRELDVYQQAFCANIAEAWRKRRYEAAFINMLSDAETEAAETQVWIEFAVKCAYMKPESGRDLYKNYDMIIGMIVKMINHSSIWIIKK